MILQPGSVEEAFRDTQSTLVSLVFLEILLCSGALKYPETK